MDFSIRVADTNDISSLNTLVNSAYRGESSKRGWTTETDLLGGQRTDVCSLSHLIDKPDTIVLLMHSGPQFMACVELQRLPERAYLGMLTVHPEAQAGGIGRRLLEFAEEWVWKNWSVTTIEMTVIQQRKELIAWYERRGYQLTSRTKPFPYGDERFGIPKVPDLIFVVLEKTFTPAEESFFSL